MTQKALVDLPAGSFLTSQVKPYMLRKDKIWIEI